MQAPELRVISGPGQNSTLVLIDEGQTYSVGDGRSDLAIDGMTGRLMIQRVAGPDAPQARLVAAAGLTVRVNGSSVSLPRALESGDAIELSSAATVILEYSEPTGRPGTETAETDVPEDIEATTYQPLPIGTPKPDTAGEEVTAGSGVDTEAEAPAETSEEPVLGDDEATAFVDRDQVDKIVAEAQAKEIPAEPDPTEAAEDDAAEDATVMADGPLVPPADPPAEPEESEAEKTIFAPPPPPPKDLQEGTADTSEPEESAAPPSDSPETEAETEAERTVLAPPSESAGASSADESEAERTILSSPSPGDTEEQTILSDSLPAEDRTITAPEGVIPPSAPAPPAEDQTIMAPEGVLPSPSAPPAPEPPSPPVSPAPESPAPEKPAKSGGMKILLYGGLFMFLLVIAGAVAIVLFINKRMGGPETPTATPVVVETTPPPPETPTPVATATPEPAGGINIVRLDPPSAPPGEVVSVQVDTMQPEARVFFGPTAAREVERTTDMIRVEVPDIPGASQLGVTVRSGAEVSAPREFTIDTPALPAITFRYEIQEGAFEGEDAATMFVGPVPVFVMIDKGKATSMEDWAKLTAVELEGARKTLATNPDARLVIKSQRRRGWNIVVTGADDKVLHQLHTVNSDLVEFVSGETPIPVEKLAGYWMSLLHDAIAVGFGETAQRLLPADAAPARVLAKMGAGSLDTTFPRLSPEERTTLSQAAVNVPDEFASFVGSYEGITTVDKVALPEINWPNAELKIELSVDKLEGLSASGNVSLTWITALDAGGRNKTYQKLGDFPYSSGRIDPSNFNRLSVTINHADVDIVFDMIRNVEPVTKKRSLDGTYGQTRFQLSPI